MDNSLDAKNKKQTLAEQISIVAEREAEAMKRAFKSVSRDFGHRLRKGQAHH